MATHPPITGTPAEIYEQHMVPAIFARWAPDLVEAAAVRSGDRALDVACGTGAVTRHLAERVGPAGTVVGLAMRRVLKPGGRLALSCWHAVEHMLGYLALEQALAKRVGPEQAALPPFSLGDADTLRRLVTGAGFRTVRLRVDAKLIRFHSAEHMVRAVVGGAPTMLGALAEQGAGVLDAIVAEVSAATRAFEDDEGWAIPTVSHVVTAMA